MNIHEQKEHVEKSIQIRYFVKVLKSTNATELSGYINKYASAVMSIQLLEVNNTLCQAK